jgi:glycosyltransferase involved in cell wall biosynthesis
LISPLHLKRIYTHLWVAGVYQYEYARKLGFKKKNIIFNALSCDVQLFENLSLSNKQFDYPKNFIYIGKFSTEKGLNYLLDAWEDIEDKMDWTLTLIGEGPLKNYFIDKKNIIIKDFMSHNDLLKEINNSGCFILPSIYEQWALVIHEAAASGLPIICTEICGAAPHFVIDNYNGYKVKSKESHDLKKAIQKIILLDKNELLLYSNRSRALAKSIRPELGLANLVGLIS